MSSPSKPKHMDLYSGIGGFALGARWAGYETISNSEIEPFCHDVLTKRFPDVPNLGDVRKLCRRCGDCIPLAASSFHPDLPADAPEFGDADDFLVCPICSAEAGCPVDFGDCDCIGADQFTSDYGWPDVLTAGSPCQDFSLNGKGAGIEGERSGLIMEIPRIAGELYPPFIVLENVVGIKARGFDTVAAALEGIDYTCVPLVVPVAAFGGSHLRERLFLVAHHPGIGMEGLWPEGFEVSHPLGGPSLSVRHRDGQWKVEPDVRRVAHGVPAGVDGSGRGHRHRSDRLHAVGNSVMPQIAACLLDLIRHYALKHKPLFPSSRHA